MTANLAELLVVLAFTSLPTLIYSIANYLHPPAGNSSSSSQQFAQILNAARTTIPLLYIVRLNGGNFRNLGLVRPRLTDCDLDRHPFGGRIRWRRPLCND